MVLLETTLSIASEDEALRRHIWNRSHEVPWLRPERFRCDHADRLMKWEEYGNRASKVGWGLAYLHAPTDSGADHVDNLHAVALGEIITSPDEAG